MDCGSYVGIIQIRSKGRSFQLPLSLSGQTAHKLPCYEIVRMHEKTETPRIGVSVTECSADPYGGITRIRCWADRTAWKGGADTPAGSKLDDFLSAC